MNLLNWIFENASSKYVRVYILDCYCDACIASLANCVKLLVKCSGSDINIQDYNGETPLHLAAENQATKAAEVLLYNGADVSIK